MALEMKYNYAQLQSAQESRQIRLKLLLAGSAIASVLIILLLVLFLQKQRIKVKNSRLQQRILDDQLETRNRELASHVLNMVRVNERKMSLIETLREQLPNVKNTGQSNRAIELARIRLRKQLGLTNQNVSLSNFLSSL